MKILDNEQSKDGKGASSQLDRLLTVEEVAEILRVKRSYVYEKSRLGILPSLKIGKYLRFTVEDIRIFINHN